MKKLMISKVLKKVKDIWSYMRAPSSKEELIERIYSKNGLDPYHFDLGPKIFENDFLSRSGKSSKNQKARW